MVVSTFLCLKIGCLKARVRTIAHPSWFSRFGAFCYTYRLLIHWHTALGRTQYANGRTTIVRTARAAENGQKTCGSSLKKWDGVLAVPAMVVWPLAYSSRHSAKCPLCHTRGNRSRVIAKSGKRESQFLYLWMCFFTYCSFEAAYF
jgi:hypothetical protein